MMLPVVSGVMLTLQMTSPNTTVMQLMTSLPRTVTMNKSKIKHGASLLLLLEECGTKIVSL